MKGEVPEEEYFLPIGKGEIKKHGTHLSIITYGLMLHYCLEVAEILSSDGIDIEILDLRTLRPLDQNLIVSSVKKTGRAMIVHEDTKALGVGAEVSAIIAEQAFDYLDAPCLLYTSPSPRD